jgi:hypothetical protein
MFRCKPSYLGAGLLTLTLAIVSAQASSPGSIYKSDDWPSEYPAGIVTTKAVKTLGRALPDFSAPKTVKCDLSNGLTLHTWSIKQQERQTQWIYLSRIIRFKALEDISDVENDLKIKSGDILEELAYQSEGFCKIRAEGKSEEFSWPCPSHDEKKFERLPDQKNGQELWAGIRCKSGQTAYFLMESDGFDSSSSIDGSSCSSGARSGAVSEARTGSISGAIAGAITRSIPGGIAGAIAGIFSRRVSDSKTCHVSRAQEIHASRAQEIKDNQDAGLTLSQEMIIGYGEIKEDHF